MGDLSDRMCGEYSDHSWTPNPAPRRPAPTKPARWDWRYFCRTMRNSFDDEDDLQRTVESILASAGAVFEREARMTERERIDFLVREDEMRIGIECKIRPGGMAVWRQLSRYADHVDAMILITTGPLDRTLDLYKSDGKTVVHLEIIELWKNM